jgi:hypothetical protein
VCRRYANRSERDIAIRSHPATFARPAVGASIPANNDNNVDFPDPDAPTTATISPAPTNRSRPCNACTSIDPV